MKRKKRFLRAAICLRVIPKKLGGGRGHIVGSGGRIVWLGRSRKGSGISIGRLQARNWELKVAYQDCI